MVEQILLLPFVLARPGWLVGFGFIFFFFVFCFFRGVFATTKSTMVGKVRRSCLRVCQLFGLLNAP